MKLWRKSLCHELDILDFSSQKKGWGEMELSSGYSFGVRQGLIEKGIANNDIGYNPSTGYVTVKGENFLKPQKNYLGTTYTTPQDFNSAWGSYQTKLNQQNQPSSGNSFMTAGAGLEGSQYSNNSVKSGYSGNSSFGGTGYSGYNNPLEPQYNDTLAQLLNAIQNPKPVDVNQIYASPQYAARQAQAQRSAKQGIRSAQEALGASGFGRSTTLAERAQGIQNDANEYLETQVIPQLMAAAQADKQQQLANQKAALDALMQGVNMYDNRFNNDRDYNLRIDELTGKVMTDRDRRAMPLLEQLIAYGNEFGSANQQRQAELRAMADANRAALSKMGIDPSLYDPNLSTEQRIAALNKLGTPTLAAQNQTFNQNMAQTELMAALTGRMPDGTPTTAEQQRQLTNLWQVAEQTGRIPDELANLYGIPMGTPTQSAKQFAQQLAISQQNANTSAASQGTAASNASFNQLMDVWAATGKAPDGLQQWGIQPGTAYNGGSSSSSSSKVDKYSYKEDPDFLDDYSAALSDPYEFSNFMKNNYDAIVKKYGIDGYNALKSALPKEE